MNDSANSPSDKGAVASTTAAYESSTRPWYRRHRCKLLALAIVLACVPHTVYFFKVYVRYSLTEDRATGAITRMIQQRVAQGDVAGLEPLKTLTWYPGSCSFLLMENLYNTCKSVYIGASTSILSDELRDQVLSKLLPLATDPCSQFGPSFPLPEPAHELYNMLGCGGKPTLYDVTLSYGFGATRKPITLIHTKGQIR